MGLLLFSIVSSAALGLWLGLILGQLCNGWEVDDERDAD